MTSKSFILEQITHNFNMGLDQILLFFYIDFYHDHFGGHDSSGTQGERVKEYFHHK